MLYIIKVLDLINIIRELFILKTNKKAKNYPPGQINTTINQLLIKINKTL